MSQTRYKMPYDDVRLSCIGFVRGYARRLEAESLSCAEERIQTAIEQAVACVGCDIEQEWIRKRLREEFFNSYMMGREYCYEHHYVPTIGRSSFYERRRKFLRDIAAYLQLI